MVCVNEQADRIARDATTGQGVIDPPVASWAIPRTAFTSEGADDQQQLAALGRVKAKARGEGSRMRGCGCGTTLHRPPRYRASAAAKMLRPRLASICAASSAPAEPPETLGGSGTKLKGAAG